MGRGREGGNGGKEREVRKEGEGGEKMKMEWRGWEVTYWSRQAVTVL
jgi:hypothetical protein